MLCEVRSFSLLSISTTPSPYAICFACRIFPLGLFRVNSLVALPPCWSTVRPRRQQPPELDPTTTNELTCRPHRWPHVLGFLSCIYSLAGLAWFKYMVKADFFGEWYWVMINSFTDTTIHRTMSKLIIKRALGFWFRNGLHGSKWLLALWYL